MQRHPEIVKLMLQNIEVVEQLPELLDEIDTLFICNLIQAIAAISSKQTGWGVDYTCTADDQSLDFAPEEWLREKKDNCYSTFTFCNCGHEDYHWLAHAIGVAGSSLGFCFYSTGDLFNIESLVGQARIRDFWNENYVDLANLGFTLTQCWPEEKRQPLYYITLPFTFEKENLAGSYPDFTTLFSEKMPDIITRLTKAKPIFDNFFAAIN